MELLRGSVEVKKWKKMVSKAKRGDPVDGKYNSQVFSPSFVGQDLFIEFDGEWFPCRCLYGKRAMAFFLSSDETGFQMTKKDFKSAVENDRVRFLVKS